MKPWIKKISFISLGLLALMLLTAIAAVTVAVAADGYDLSWWTVDSGGGVSSGNGYTLSGTLGQPDAGALASGGGYTLAGGFWHAGVIPQAERKIVYLPLVVR